MSFAVPSDFISECRLSGFGEPCATLFQLPGERNYFRLHLRCSPEKLSHLVPVLVAQIAVVHGQFMDFLQGNPEVNLIIGIHLALSIDVTPSLD
ncbi:hypothetical protein [Burkholderia sola]|uniref:hypothetical protein n=1 Tax=Burkholderia sola TaxID=2843302 RepID=UPI001C0A8392